MDIQSLIIDLVNNFDKRVELIDERTNISYAIDGVEESGRCVYLRFTSDEGGE